MKALARWRRPALAAALALAGCATVGPPATPDAPRQGRPQQIIVTLRDAPPAALEAARRAIAAEHGLRETGAFPLAALGVHCVVFELDSQATLAVAVQRLAGDPRVDAVQPNQAFAAQAAPGEAYRALAWAAGAMRADRAHRSRTGKGVRIAVVDTGADRRHPALQPGIVQSASFVDRGDASFDGDRHGTAVAGLIAARGGLPGPALGIAPGAELMALKACWHPAATGPAVCSSWTLARAVDHAIGAGAQVLNLSLSGPPDALLARLLGVAAARGITVVAAAATGPGGPGFPASLDGVIAVVASDARGRVSPPAWQPARPLLAAPGVEVVSTAPGAGYDLVSGSSFAAAHVSAVAALLLERSPGLQPAQAARLLQAGARPATTGGVGIVDACGALAAQGDDDAC